MKRLVVKDGFAFIYLNRDFYSKTGVEKAISAYEDFLKASISSTKKYFIIKLKKIDENYSLKTLSNEFLNYLIQIEKEVEMVAQ